MCPRSLIRFFAAALVAMTTGCGVKMVAAPRVLLYGEGLAHGDGQSQSCETLKDELCRREAAWASCQGDCAPERTALRNELQARWNDCEQDARAGTPMKLGRVRDCDGIRNRLYLLQNHSREWTYKRDTPTRPFEHALAISGGGIRSAVFAIGVMSGLQEIGVFDEVDAISAVSGGSYAATWYYMQQYRCHERTRATRATEDVRHQVLETHGPFQEYLAKNAGVWPLTRLGVLGVADTITSPANLVANGLLGWHSNTTPAQWDYETRLASHFNHVPPEACPSARNVGTASRAIGFAELKTFAKERRLPYLIVNTTAYVEDDKSYQGAVFANSVYELGLERSGSQGFGTFATPDMSVRTAVAISGAAADSSLAAGSAPKLIFSALNHDLGVYVDNPRFDPKQVDAACDQAPDRTACLEQLRLNVPAWRWLARRVTPAPFYMADPLYKKDATGARVYLTDGGHSENLGAYSLVRRLPKTLTIVDGEHDPTFEFGAYHRLKQALRSELGVELQVPGIDYPRKPEGWSPFTNELPVMRGQIGTFWVRDAAGLHPVTIDVRYIKLSFDARKLDLYWNTAFRSYYEANFGSLPPPNLGEPCPCPWSCPFPQQWTFDMEFSEEQFRAYRDLGRWLVVKHYRSADGAPVRERRSPSRP